MIHGIGESTYDGWYEAFIFGSYSFVSIDSRGNNVYVANRDAKYDDLYEEYNMPPYIYKHQLDRDWVVNLAFLY